MSSNLSPEIFRTILQEVDLAVRVFDPKTHEIIWMNNLSEKDVSDIHWHGEKCHKVFHGLDAPCASCPKDKITEKGFHKWQHFSARLGRHFEFKSKLIKINNRTLWLDIAEDISERVQKQEQLQTLYENDHALVQIMRLLTSEEKKYDIFEKTLALAGKQYNADRAFIFLCDEDIDGKETTISCAHEWCAPDVPSQKDELQYIPVTKAPLLFDFLNGNSEIIINDIETIKQEHPALYQILVEHDVQKLFAIPIYRNNNLAGTITLDNPKSQLNDLTILTSIAHFAGTHLAQQAETEHLRKIGMIDSFTGVGSKEAFIRRRAVLEKSVDHRLGLIYADLNSLKTMNNTQSRGRGDLFIQSVSGLFLQYFKSSDVFRLGDDEFIFLCSGISEQHFYEKARLLLTECDRRFPKKVSFGLLWQEKPSSFDTMMDEVDQLMQVDKQRKKEKPQENLFPE